MGENDVEPDILDQVTNHHGNTDEKDNDYSHSYETPPKIAVLLLFVIQYSPQQNQYCPH